MKAYLFFESTLAKVSPAFRDFVERCNDHNFEIPEKAQSFNYACWVPGEARVYQSIPIPRPKKKVKKWIYEFVCNRVVWRSTSPLSEEEYDKQPMTGHKIYETEIEVEE